MTFQTIQRSLLIASLLVTVLILASCQPLLNSESENSEAQSEETETQPQSDTEDDADETEELNFNDELQRLDAYVDSDESDSTEADGSTDEDDS